MVVLRGATSQRNRSLWLNWPMGARSPSVRPISPAAKLASSALIPYHCSNNGLLSIIRQEPARGNSERMYVKDNPTNCALMRFGMLVCKA